ncbi:chaperonin [Sediminicola sp. YIK13]|uniref:head GIN domain-containing protein n=1 Tax=Sediminicola sp. YIK13 TaxID=1453352 RepID=UPI00072197FF|nr:head GIN domain-containing protein [Sediminicola sp. YIK13]ALM09286.1 chaperonin [Sediminicola sp. YIK13]
MKHLFWIFFICFGTHISSGQNEKITQELQIFKEIKAFDGISVNLIRSSVNKAVITGANTKKVAIVNNEGILKIRMEVGKIFSGYRTFIDVYYTENLRVIDGNEDARITSDDVIKQEILELKAQEGAELIIKAQVEQLLVKTVTGGVIKASGTSDNQDVLINTGGVYDGKEFKTKFSTVNVNAGSRASINASSYVKAVVKAGGEVLVYGNPTKIEEKTIFGGTIRKM